MNRMVTRDIKISIIVPIYNVEKYLNECLDSICTQCIFDCVELILVDDGSTDRSGEMCDDYAQKYHFITVIHQENKGLGGARNAGTKIARGRYIAWIDSDDIIEEQWVSMIVDTIDKYDPDVIIYDYELFGDSNRRIIKYGRRPGYIEKSIFLEDIIRDTRIKAYAWQKVIKSNFCKAELFIENKMPLEDFEAIYRLLRNIDTVYYINFSLYKYRQRNNSLIKDHNFEKTLHSYNLAKKRKNQVRDTKYKRAACTAMAIQAFRLYKHEVKGDHETDLNESLLARKYISKNLLLLCLDFELSIKWKIIFVLSACNLKNIIRRLIK